MEATGKTLAGPAPPTSAKGARLRSMNTLLLAVPLSPTSRKAGARGQTLAAETTGTLPSALAGTAALPVTLKCRGRTTAHCGTLLCCSTQPPVLTSWDTSPDFLQPEFGRGRLQVVIREVWRMRRDSSAGLRAPGHALTVLPWRNAPGVCVCVCVCSNRS